MTVLWEAPRPWLALLVGIVTALVLGALLFKLRQGLRHRQLVTTGALAIGRVRGAELKRPRRPGSFYLIDYEFKDSNGRPVQGQARVSKLVYAGEKTLAVFFAPNDPRKHVLALAAFYEPKDVTVSAKTPAASEPTP